MPGIDQSKISNRILSELSESDFNRLRDKLVLFDLPRSKELTTPGEIVEYCWFIESGVASVVAASRRGHETEVGIVGHEGMIDVATILGADRSPLRSFIQISGSGFRLPARELIQARQSSPSLQARLDRYAYSYLIQLAQTALANASFKVEERLARWLLMCGDRVGDDEIILTHEFLSVMLNVRRAGVSQAIQTLKQAGLVATQRGALWIVNRTALESFAHDAYAPFS